jgi:hypothetical protein
VNRAHLYKKIDIALLRPFAACKRAENTQVINAMLLADFKNLLAFGLEKFFDLHSIIIQQRIFRSSQCPSETVDKALRMFLSAEPLVSTEFEKGKRPAS